MRLLFLLPLLAACSRAPKALPAAIDEVVLAANHPLEYVAGRIAGDAVPVENPLPTGQDPQHWNPSREDLVRCQRARLILLSGAGYEGWVTGVSLPTSRVVDTSRGFPEGSLLETGARTHSHGLDGEHSHAEAAGLVWLTPRLLTLQARQVHRAMARSWPDHADLFSQGLLELEGDLEALGAELDAALEGARVVASDPGLGYLGESVQGFDLDPEGPSSGALERLKAALEERPARVLLWPAPPEGAVEAHLQEHLGLTSVVLNTASNPVEGDYLTIMRANIQRLTEALR